MEKMREARSGEQEKWYKEMHSRRWAGMRTQQEQRHKRTLQIMIRVSRWPGVHGAPLRDAESSSVLFFFFFPVLSTHKSCREMKLSVRGGKCESNSGETFSQY